MLKANPEDRRFTLDEYEFMAYQWSVPPGDPEYMTAMEIGALLGRTRESVLGYAFRQLGGRKGFPKYEADKLAEARARKYVLSLSVLEADAQPPRQTREVRSMPNSGRCAFLTDMAAVTLCGESTHGGGAYCPEHAAMVVPGKSSEKRRLHPGAK